MERKVFMFMMRKKLDYLRTVTLNVIILMMKKYSTPDDFEFEIICTQVEFQRDPFVMKIYSTMCRDIIDCFDDELLIS